MAGIPTRLPSPEESGAASLDSLRGNDSGSRGEYDFPSGKQFALHMTDTSHITKRAQLRAKVTPDFEFGCRRPTPADQYVACIQEKNVDVIRTAVENVKAEGIVTSDGVEHHYDVVSTEFRRGQLTRRTKFPEG